MARTSTLYNARFSVSGASWWDATTDASVWTSVAAMTGQAPAIDNPANRVSVYQNLVASANNILYWVGIVAGVPTLFSFDGTTQTTLSTFPDQDGQPATECNAVCEFDSNVYFLIGYAAGTAGTTVLYRWNPDTQALTGISGSVTDAGARGHLCSALGLLWMIQSPIDPGKLYRIDPRTTGGWTLDTTAAAGTQYTSCVGYQGSLFVASRAALAVNVLSKNSVAGVLASRFGSLAVANEGIWRFVPDEANSLLLAYRSDLATTAAVLKSATGLSGWSQDVNLITALAVDPTALVGQGAAFDDKQFLAYVGAGGDLIQRNAGVYSFVHAGPVGLGMGVIQAPAPPSAGRGFSLIQAGDKLYALTLSGDFSKEIVMPVGVTIDGTARIRYAILSRKIVISGTPGISEPIFIDPKTLLAYKLRMAAPVTAPILTGGAVNGLAYGWVTFIQKIDNIVVNESPLSSASAQSTSRVFTAIAVPPGGSNATGRRLYRSVVNGTVPFQAVDIDDIVTTTFDTNAITDAMLQLNPSDPELGEAPSDLDIIVSWRDRMWARSATDGQQDNGYFTAVGAYWAWGPFDFLPAQPLGEDVFGITGWLPRRDELGMLKRARVLKIVGTGIDADFDVIVVADGIGCVSADSCVVIRDIGYFMGQDGPYLFGPQGVQPIFDKKVTPWFQTDTYFNRSMFRQAIAGYNSINDTYDLHLASAGSTVLDRWVSFDIKRQEWLGPHLTNAFTTYGRGMLRDEDAQYQPSMGGNDGFVYKMNRPGASDEGVAIAIDWILGWLSGNAPDIEHRWLQATVFVRIEASATGKLLLTARVGGLNAPDTASLEIDLTTDRTRLPRLGAGRLLRLQFTHSTNGEDVLVEALEVPFNEIGRR